jgi:DedD protein
VDDKASLGGKEEIVSSAPLTGEKKEQKQQVAVSNAAQSATKSVATIAPAGPDKVAVDKAAAAKANAEKLASDKAAAEKAAAEKAASAKAAADKTKGDAAKAQALLEGKATPAPAVSGGERFIVQFGSFADETKAREVRQKVEKAGLKTYAQVAQTSEGKRHRARVGPFATRAEAEKAAAKIKSLDLPANILTL